MRRCLAFFLLALGLGIAPGPDILFVFAQSLAQGPGAGAMVTLGLCSGLVVHVALAAFGFAAVMKRYPQAFKAITWAGAGYLVYLGIMAWRSASLSGAALTEVTRLSGLRLYLQGVIMNLCNPKVILFFIALMPRFVVPEKGHCALQFLGLGMIFIFATLLVFNGVALLGGSVAWCFEGNTTAAANLRYLSAVVMLLLAGWIAWMNLRKDDKS